MWPLLLLLLVIITTVLFYHSQKQRNKKITLWQNALALDKHFAVFQQLYADMNGFALSKEARLDSDALEYVYGEIEFESFIALLSLCHPDSSTVFYDLGSGTGKAVLACAMVFNVKKSCGIELFASLHQSAELQKQRLSERPGYLEIASCIDFKKGDFLQIPFDDASLIFINATAFFGEAWQTISKSVEQIKPGSLVITTSKALTSNLFACLRTTKVAMSWGIVNAFIQQRLNI
ncbi:MULTISPECIES: methyltransferase domain-containing protein [Legionella]|nr:methyltransferase domain-containing protein [Legionella maceachernii]